MLSLFLLIGIWGFCCVNNYAFKNKKELEHYLSIIALIFMIGGYFLMVEKLNKMKWNEELIIKTIKK